MVDAGVTLAPPARPPAGRDRTGGEAVAGVLQVRGSAAAVLGPLQSHRSLSQCQAFPEEPWPRDYPSCSPQLEEGGGGRA